MKKILLQVILFLLVAGCSNRSIIIDKGAYAAEASVVNIEANLRFLADDELEGREAATRGERIAAQFISSELRKYGVKPAGDNGTYLQRFGLESVRYDSSSHIVLVGEGNEDTLKYYEDFVRFYSFNSETSDSLEMVFVGYGVNAAEAGYNDYEGIDIKGKVAVAVSGAPDPRYGQYATSRAKLEAAKNAGATSILFILDKESSTRWQISAGYLSNPSIKLAAKDPQFTSFRINNSSAGRLFSNSKLSFEEVEAIAGTGEAMPVFPLAARLSPRIKINTEVKDAFNVVGIIEGRDSLLKGEYVALGAHYDHVGIRNGLIFNGADDNGSGTVALLEAARLLSESGNNNRSILIAFHSAEEKGLLGAEYLVDNIPFISDVIAHINMDMVGREHIDSIHLIGADRLSTQLSDIIHEANSASVNFKFNYRFNDPVDPNQFYFRSDHFHYAKKKIPVAFLFDYMTADYHKDTDTVEKINFEKIAKVSELVYTIAAKLATLEGRLKLNKAEELTGESTR